MCFRFCKPKADSRCICSRKIGILVEKSGFCKPKADGFWGKECVGFACHKASAGKILGLFGFVIWRKVVDLGRICDKKMVKNWYFFVFLCKKRALFVIFW